MGSFFEDLVYKPLDLNFGPATLARADPHPDKLDLSLGVYRSELGKPVLFNVVAEVRGMIASDKAQMEEYLPLLGNPDFSEVSRDLLFKTPDTDEAEYKLLCERICSLHTASATNGIFLGLLLLKYHIKLAKRTHTSNPCWVGYPTIVDNVGLEYHEHKYLNFVDSTLDLEGILSYYETLERGDILLIQVSGHNPCGVDPNREEWERIGEVIKRKGLIPFLDIAYQGYASGDIVEDAYPIRMFAALEVDFFVSHSFSKMMTIYSGRLGCLHVVLGRKDERLRENLISNLRHMARGIHGTPVRLYSEIALKILTTPSLKERWLEELRGAYMRIKKARELLYKRLNELKVPGKWEHVINQKGMFCYLNISERLVHRLREKHHIYLIFNSRICIAQLNDKRVEIFAKALKDVLENE
ncbi:aspartate aminotransferase, cytoplasmic, putative [Theileria annulata]|uniref:Aspartate aminotransferase, cytoplasmic, putative n=1 Tax=Theileria annulata TaxID=5874 RepID=Q4UDB3_THEAN|nr:aspartate aminotransferase, cytoplasmic, putative [Theileria annulata]CAI74926.1 aspartate aminotransferase, cytoplasmic, putative [Theileria annulata]|eukprot:XP_952658.1 aspartate aminotransferase, cytoplasmic, putative [Theileria annulata]